MNHALWFLLLLYGSAWAGPVPGSPTPACTMLLPRSADDQDARIDRAGSYCLGSDFQQRALHGAGHSGPGFDHALISIAGGDVNIDLRQHTLHAGVRSHGLRLAAGSNAGVARDLKREFGMSSRNVTVRNGVIDLRGIGTGVRFIRKWTLIMLDEKIPAAAVPYEKTRYVLENLTIKTDNVGIQLEGDGNIVRNCNIESDGDAAIVMAGPNSQILNNTIVLGEPLIPTWTKSGERVNPLAMAYKMPAARRQTRAAIVLQDGSAALVRGNRIEVKGKSATRHSIYLNNGSKDVLINGNTFVDGIDAPLLGNDSSSQMIDNRAAMAGSHQ